MIREWIEIISEIAAVTVFFYVFMLVVCFAFAAVYYF